MRTADHPYVDESPHHRRRGCIRRKARMDTGNMLKPACHSPWRAATIGARPHAGQYHERQRKDPALERGFQLQVFVGEPGVENTSSLILRASNVTGAHHRWRDRDDAGCRHNPRTVTTPDRRLPDRMTRWSMGRPHLRIDSTPRLWESTSTQRTG